KYPCRGAFFRFFNSERIFPTGCSVKSSFPAILKPLHAGPGRTVAYTLVGVPVRRTGANPEKTQAYTPSERVLLPRESSPPLQRKIIFPRHAKTPPRRSHNAGLSWKRFQPASSGVRANRSPTVADVTCRSSAFVTSCISDKWALGLFQQTTSASTPQQCQDAVCFLICWRSRSSRSLISGVSSAPKSAASNTCRTSTSVPPSNGARFSHSIASSFDFTCHSQKPAISSLLSAKGPSITV